MLHDNLGSGSDFSGHYGSKSDPEKDKKVKDPSGFGSGSATLTFSVGYCFFNITVECINLPRIFKSLKVWGIDRFS